KSPDGTGLAGKWSWGEKHNNYQEVHLVRAKDLPGFEDACDGTVSFRVYSEGTAAVRRINLRLIDAQGEVFQITKPVTFEKKGWQELSYRIPPNAPYDSWGGVVNKKFDLPVKLQALIVDFTPQVAESGTLYFDDIDCTGVGNKVDTYRPLWDFTSRDAWRLAGDPNITSLDTSGKQAIIVAHPTNKTLYLSLSERKMGMLTDAAPTSYTIKANLLSGNGIALGFHLRDAQGEIFKFQAKPLMPGANTLVWKVPDDKADSWGASKNGVIDFPVNVYELTVLRTAGQGEAKVELNEAGISERIPASEAITLDVETGTPIHVLRVGDEKKLAVRVNNTAMTPQTFTLALKLTNIDQETMDFSRSFTLPAMGSASWQLPSVPKKLGIWWVNYTVTDASGTAKATGRTSFSYMNPAGPTPGLANGFLFSICTHTERWSKNDAQLEVLAAGMCGAKVMRTGPEWGSIEPTEGTWQWDKFDWIVDEYAKQGMELEYPFAFSPGWAVADQSALAKGWSYFSRKCPRLDAWSQYCSAVATRYKGKMRLFEVWNEPDIGFWNDGLEEYLQIQKAAYEAVHQANPQARVMNGGLANFDHPQRKQGFAEGLATRGQSSMDILALHMHGPFSNFQQTVDGKVAEIRKMFKGNMPIYYNETAIPSMDDAQKMQAETLVKKLIFAWARGSIGYTWYDLRNDGFNPKDGEHNFGMVTNDFYPKAVYPTYNTLALNLNDKKYLGELKLGAGQWGFVFGNAQDEIVVTWSDIVGSTEDSYILQTNAQSASSMDMMDNQTPTPVVGGCVVLPVGSTPKFVVLKKASGLPSVRQQLVAISELQPGVPGGTVAVKAEFANPFPKAQTVTVTWKVASDIMGNTQEQTVTIPGNGKEKATLQVTIPQNIKAQYGDSRMVQLSYRFSGTPWAGSVQIPINIAAYIPTTEMNTRPADFSMADRGHIHNLYENDPNTANLTWKGPQDLSARAWLGRSRDALILKIDVQDDIFSQKFANDEVWKGDNIQFALFIPGQLGSWECGLTRLADGSPSVFTWTKPTGFADPSKQVTLQTELKNGELIYTATLPYSAFGLSDSILESGIKFNFIANDNDGDSREGWVFLTRGIGETKDPTLYPFVVFAKK
ncbi:MAG TPA: hypothetical protein VHV83_18215, partial [Armatimonadota bacterium]|nr:hypothetical protein [Armatimonadota bacterium]